MTTQFSTLIQGLDLNLEILPKGWDVILSPRFLTYTPFQELLIETPNYLLKTARSSKELIEVFDLRYRCFLEDSTEGPVDELDIDEFDHICDHMVIQCKKSGNIIGTYRLISSDRSDRFYSQGEFNLDNFLKAPGKKLELGRACIDVNHRNGNVIDLLWKGIATYITKTNSQFLFGCSSVHTTRKDLSWKIFDFMQLKGWVEEDHQIHPIGKYAFDYVDSQMDPMDAKNYVPALLRSYITAGAKIYAAPALDEEFSCVDFLTILDMKNLSRLYKKRYFKS